MKRHNNPYVHTSQFEPEFSRLVALYRDLEPKTVLEIGTEYGGTLWYWTHLAKPGTKIANIEMVITRGHGMILPLMWQSWLPEGVELTTIQGRSQDAHVENQVVEYLGDLGDKIDFCFIDGDHTYKGVKHDFYVYGMRSKVVVFHDLIRHKPHFGVGQLFNELKPNYKTDEFWSDGPRHQPGGGIGVVYVNSN
jgi:cephalosporin hydroxylase